MLKFRLVAFYDTQDERHHYSDPVKHGKINERLRKLLSNDLCIHRSSLNLSLKHFLFSLESVIGICV